MEGPEQFVRQMEEFIRSRRLLEDGQAVLAAVSGGADSVAMLCALHRSGRYAVHVGHVDHGLRPQAAADARFVEDLAGSWGLPFHLRRIDTPALAERWGVGTEEAARRGRYEALADLAEQAGTPAVAVAHHADDQVETILHRLLRGTHLRGAAGMPVRRRLREGVRLVRPLLWARRAQVEAFCRDAGLPWRTDPTNALPDFTRNFIRNELLPLVRRRINVRTDEALLRLASAAGEAEQALAQLAGELLKRARRKRSAGQVVLRIAPLKKAPPVLSAMVLRAALEDLSAPQQELTQDRFSDLLLVVEGKVPAADLPGGVRAERRDAFLHLFRPDAPAEPG